MANSLCVIGGGPAGVGLLWTLAQDPSVASDLDVTLIHNEPHVGGHCSTFPVQGPASGDATIPVDIGVQFVSPLINPNVSLMSEREHFKQNAPIVPAAPLTLSSAFPNDPATGQPMNWGNFPEYQSGDKFQLWNRPGMKEDCELLQNFLRNPIEDALWLTKSLQDWFDAHESQLNNPHDFLYYFLDPYLTVMNGYGAPALDSVLIYDLIPLFDKVPLFDGPMGSWTEPGVGWQRWENGATSWVQAMLDEAQAGPFASLSIFTDSSANGVWLDPNDTAGDVTVSWAPNQAGPSVTKSFNKVVLTTDMRTNAKLLDNDKNAGAWEKYYADILSDKRWGKLQDGTCFIHTDNTILAPDLQEQQEVVQFTAWYSDKDVPADQPYNTDTTYATYLIKNVKQDPKADGLFVTMYGPDPDKSKGPADDKVLVRQDFIHGLWLPGAMTDSTKVVHRAQGKGGIHGGHSHTPNTGTNLYFAGNNTTMDSVEGALVSSMVIANYIYGVPYPLDDPHWLFVPARAMYEALYLELMFPTEHTGLKHHLLGKLSRALHRLGG